MNKIRLEKFEYCNVGANHSRFVKSPIFYLTRLPNTFHTKQTYSLFFEGELLYVCLATRGQGGGCGNHALLRNKKQDKSVPAEPKGRILMSVVAYSHCVKPKLDIAHEYSSLSET